MMIIKSLSLLLLAGSALGEPDDAPRGRRIVSVKKDAEESLQASEEKRRTLWNRNSWHDSQMYDAYDMGGMHTRGNSYAKDYDAKSSKKKSMKKNSYKNGSNGKKGSYDSWSGVEKHEPPTYQFIQSVGCVGGCIEASGGDIVGAECDDCEMGQKWRTVGACNGGTSTDCQYVQYQSAENPHKCIAVPPGTTAAECELLDDLITADCLDMYGKPREETIFSNAGGLIVSIYCWNRGVPALLTTDVNANDDCTEVGLYNNVLGILDGEPSSDPIYSYQQFNFGECLLFPTACSKDPMWW